MASGVANVTPGNLGVEQAAAMFTAHLLGVRPEVGFLASSLFRVMAIVVVFAIGPILGHWLANQTPKSARTTPETTNAEGLNEVPDKGRGPIARATLG
jgi:hypothetical protein